MRCPGKRSGKTRAEGHHDWTVPALRRWVQGGGELHCWARVVSACWVFGSRPTLSPTNLLASSARKRMPANASDGIVKRVAFDVVPPHVEYSLTPLGCEAAEKVRQLADWIEASLPQIAAGWNQKEAGGNRSSVPSARRICHEGLGGDVSLANPSHAGCQESPGERAADRTAECIIPGVERR